MAALGVWILAMAALFASRGFDFGALGTNLLVGPIFVLLPFWMTRRVAGRDPLGLSPQHLARSIGLAVVMALLTLPLFVWIAGGPHEPAAGPIWGALAVALPEELFFRGYLQGAWRRLARRRVRIAGAELGWEWIAASAAFALAHVAFHGPVGLWTFFPGLAFGWAYARTGTIWASVLYHAACNVAAALA
jgi:membrane protease YdiL (CAAX protease family)